MRQPKTLLRQSKIEHETAMAFFLLNKCSDKNETKWLSFKMGQIYLEVFFGFYLTVEMDLIDYGLEIGPYTTDALSLIEISIFNTAVWI